MKTYSIVIIILLSFNLKAQDSKNNYLLLNNSELKIGYYGNLLWNNGLFIGFEHSWKENYKIKKRRKRNKVIIRQFLFNGIVGHSTNFSNKTDREITLYCGLIYRRINPKGRHLSLELNPIGYQRSILPQTYELKGGEVSKVKFPGRSYFYPSLAIGFGKFREAKVLSGWNFNFRYSLRTNYNAGNIAVVSIELTQRLNLKNK